MRLARFVLFAVGCVSCLAMAGAGDGPSRDWQVPGKKSAQIPGIQYSAEPVITCRRVGFRTKEAALDRWGSLTIYPAVRAPTGKVYYGFVRHYTAEQVGTRWLMWTFPTEFRAPGVADKTLVDSAFLDSLPDGLGEDAARVLPKGDYQVKWIVNDRLLDTGDQFTYAYQELSQPGK